MLPTLLHRAHAQVWASAQGHARVRTYALGSTGSLVYFKDLLKAPQLLLWICLLPALLYQKHARVCASVPTAANYCPDSRILLLWQPAAAVSAVANYCPGSR